MACASARRRPHTLADDDRVPVKARRCAGSASNAPVRPALADRCPRSGAVVLYLRNARTREYHKVAPVSNASARRTQPVRCPATATHNLNLTFIRKGKWELFNIWADPPPFPPCGCIVLLTNPSKFSVQSELRSNTLTSIQIPMHQSNTPTSRVTLPTRGRRRRLRSGGGRGIVRGDLEGKP